MATAQTNPKQKTYQQVVSMQDKAVRAALDLRDDPDLAEELDDLTPEEYAERKHVTIMNPRNRIHRQKLIPPGSRRRNRSAKRRNAGSGQSVDFHGAFGKKSAAVAKKKKTGGFIKGRRVGRGGDYRYVVMTPKKNSRKRGNPDTVWTCPDCETVNAEIGVPALPPTVECANCHAVFNADWQKLPNPRRASTQRRRNQGTDDAERDYEAFHGEAASEILEIKQREARKDYAALGMLASLECHSKDNCECVVYRDDTPHRNKIFEYQDPECNIIEIEFAGEEEGEEAERVILAQGAASDHEAARGEKPQQMYFIGGDQNLLPIAEANDLDTTKDFLDFGNVREVVYLAEKRFDGFEPVHYDHELGEETGDRPRLMYDKLRRRMYLVGGKYTIKPEGITN